MPIMTSSATAVRTARRFGIDANPGITEDLGGRHSALFVDVDVNAVSGLEMPSSASGGVQQYKSQIKYSDKPRWSSPVTQLCCSDETKLDDSAGSVRLTAP